MEQRERLIEIIQSSVGGCARNWAEVIADGLLANGVIALPVNAGDTIYRPFGRGVESWIVTTIVLHPDEIVFIDDSENSFKESDIGVSTFLTREKAERELERRRNEQAD